MNNERRTTNERTTHNERTKAADEVLFARPLTHCSAFKKEKTLVYLSDRTTVQRTNDERSFVCGVVEKGKWKWTVARKGEIVGEVD